MLNACVFNHLVEEIGGRDGTLRHLCSQFSEKLLPAFIKEGSPFCVVKFHVVGIKGPYYFAQLVSALVDFL